MDWKQVGQMIGPMAPTIGSIVGGLIPIPGGSMIGELAGKMAADYLGVANDPVAVANAIQADPAGASAKLQAAESEAAAKWPALAQMAQAMYQSNAAQSESINATMRAELAQGQTWWAWRNLYGYSVGIEATATSWVVLYALVMRPDIVKSVTDSLSFFLSWYGMRFGLLGYIHNQSTQEKVAAVTGQQPTSMITNIVKSIRSK